MKSKFSKMMNISFITSVWFIILGITMFILRNNKIDRLALITAGIFIFYGGANMIDDYKAFKPFYFFDGFTSGLLSIILGVIIAINRESMIVLPIIIGLWFIISSTFKLRMSLALKDTNNKAWVPTYVLSLATIVIGLYLIVYLSISNITIFMLGISFILFAIVDIIEVFIFKKNIKAIVRVFE
ncbi:MAG: DUF308 domain-containing protein [Bacilli bacterium]|nr:DUF308 domain-containing protein [Bacilli bacterium]